MSMESKMKAKHAKQIQSIVSFVAGSPQEGHLAALKEKISALGSRNKLLENKAAELERDLAGMEKANSAVSSINQSLQNELLALKGGISAIRASSRAKNQNATLLREELAAKLAHASRKLEESLEANRRLSFRASRLETELRNYEQAIAGASELLGKAKKK